MSTVSWRAMAPVLGAALLASCTSDGPTTSSIRGASWSVAGAGDKVDVCHRPGTVGGIIEIGSAAVAGHLGHGDYISTLNVSHEGVQPSDGAHFATIGGALAAARASRVATGEMSTASCRITILVSAGTYHGTVGSASGALEHFPMIVDVPDITLRGALEMALDGAGRAIGQGTTNKETVLAPVAPLPFVDFLSTPILVANGHPGGSAGNGLVVQGFVFQSGHNNPAVDAGGQAILSLRVTGLSIRGNRFEGGFTESLDLRASSGDVLENHLSGTAGTCDVCLAGPGTYVAAGNRLLAGGIPGMGATPTVLIPVPPGVEQYALPATAEVWVTIQNNEVRDHLRKPTGVGIRMDAVGVGAPNVHGTIHAVVQDNTLINNRFGMIVHAAFPMALTNRRGDVEMTLGGNVFQEVCQAKLLVAFARHNTVLGTANTPYLLNSTFRLTLNGDVSWNDAWFGHPAGFGNTLIVDGTVIANGARQFYSETTCPGS